MRREFEDYKFDFETDILNEIDAIATDYPRVPKGKITQVTTLTAVPYFDITKAVVFNEEF